MYNDKTLKSVAEAVKQVMEAELSAKQKAIAKIEHPKHKIDAGDLAALRAGKKPVKEGWDDMIKAAKEKKGPQPSGGAGKKAGHSYGGGKQKDDDKPVKEEASQEEFTAEIKKAQAKSQGKEKADVAKPAVVAVKQESVEKINEISTKMLAKAAHAASDPDADYNYDKSHDPQIYADYAKKTKDAKSAAAVQGAADAKGHYPRPGRSFGYDKLASRTPSRITSTGKANKQDVKALKSKIQRNEEVEQVNERTLSKPEAKEKERLVKSMKKNLAGFKERYGERAKSVMYATATARAKENK